MIAHSGSLPAFRSAGSAEAEPLDSAITVETPEGIEFVLVPAGPVIRGCAWGLDQAAQWILIIIASSVSNFFEGNAGSWMLLLVLFCIDWFYHLLWEIFGRGQSLGKRLLGIRVLRSDGSPVNPGASFLRNLLRFADTFLFLCPIALVTMLASRGYRRLGDWAADTLVVYTPRSLSVSVRPALVSLARKGGAAGQGTPGAEADPGIEGRAALSTLSGEERQGILMFAGRYSLLGRARADEIAAPYVGVLREDAMRRIPDDVPQDNALPGAGERPPLSAADYLLALSRRLVGT